MQKKCFKCLKVLPIFLFYKHSGMKDGHLNKCKMCAKADVRLNYSEKVEQYREYERKRYKEPKRRASLSASYKESCKRKPGKYRSRYEISNALRSGKLIKPKNCSMCGSDKRIEAHHVDYRSPLNIVWVCFSCHRHKIHGISK